MAKFFPFFERVVFSFGGKIHETFLKDHLGTKKKNPIARAQDP
jgi:hypothetical protein